MEFFMNNRLRFKHILTSVLLCFAFLKSFELFSETEKGPFLVLNNPLNPGFGAVFSSVLSALDTYDKGNYSGIKVDLNSGMYLDQKKGSNWWDYFFEPINFGDETAPNYVFSQSDVAHLVITGFPMPRERGFELIQKYIHLKPHVQKKIDHFIQKKFKEKFVIGIHHRGTDKKTEAPIVPYETIMFHVDWWVEHLPKDVKVCIFVATDDQNFLDYIRKIYPKKVIYNKFVRSKDDNPIHDNDKLYQSNYQKGEEAIIDCMLLSKTNLLIFPEASAFSIAALKFNPGLTAIPLRG